MAFQLLVTSLQYIQGKLIGRIAAVASVACKSGLMKNGEVAGSAGEKVLAALRIAKNDGFAGDIVALVGVAARILAIQLPTKGS